MEGLAELLPLLFVAAYYLLRGRQRVSQQRQRQEAPQQPLIGDGPDGARDRVSEPTPFQQFLRQVEEAVAEAAGEPLETDKQLEVETTAAPSPLPAPPTKPVRPAPLETSTEFIAPAGSFDSAHPVDPEGHGFEFAPPISVPSSEPRVRPTPPPRRPEPAAVDWQRRLRDPVAAREAFLLQTIFGPRGGRHREGPRG